jgi:hypothetical protein
VPNRANKHAAPTELHAFAVHEFYKHGATTALWLNPTTRVFNDLLSFFLRALFQKNAQFSDRSHVFSFPRHFLMRISVGRSMHLKHTLKASMSI